MADSTYASSENNAEQRIPMFIGLSPQNSIDEDVEYQTIRPAQLTDANSENAGISKRPRVSNIRSTHRAPLTDISNGKHHK